MALMGMWFFTGVATTETDCNRIIRDEFEWVFESGLDLILDEGYAAHPPTKYLSNNYNSVRLHLLRGLHSPLDMARIALLLLQSCCCCCC